MGNFEHFADNLSRCMRLLSRTHLYHTRRQSYFIPSYQLWMRLCIVKSEPALVSCAQADDTRSINLQATVDGVNIKQLDRYRATSPLFSVTYPPHNLFGSPAGQTQGISDGYWVFLQPRSSGKHELHFSGLTPGNPTTGTTNFAVDVTYHLTVQ